MKCQYCGRQQEKVFLHCPHCGGEAPEKSARPQIGSAEGFCFLLNGYVVWHLYDPARDEITVVFYRGLQVIEQFVIVRTLLREKFPIYEGSGYFDFEAFIWNLFLLAQGEQKVFTLIEQDNPYPATFEIRYIVNQDKEHWKHITNIEILAETRK